MVALTRAPRQAWVRAGLTALANGGPAAVRVEWLARTLNVTKGSFYGHFADRAALLEEMLATWERESIDEVIAEADQGSQDPRVRMRRAGALTFSTAALPLDLVVREWARHDPAIARRLQHVDNRRMDYLRAQFHAAGIHDRVEARCLLAFSLAIASPLTDAGHPDMTRAEVAELAVTLIAGTDAPEHR